MEWLSICFFIMSSANAEVLNDLSNANTSINENVAAELVDSYNESLEEAYDGEVPEYKKGITGWGSLDIMYVKDSNDEATNMIVRFLEDPKSGDQRIVFKISTEKDFRLPEEMKEVRVVYIGNQLIIDDLESNIQVNYFLPSEHASNKTPYLETVKAKMITAKRPNAVEINL